MTGTRPTPTPTPEVAPHAKPTPLPSVRSLSFRMIISGRLDQRPEPEVEEMVGLATEADEEEEGQLCMRLGSMPPQVEDVGEAEEEEEEEEGSDSDIAVWNERERK